MIFNGLMYSGDQTHLDGVTFVNTEKLTTFAALAEPGTLNRRLTRADGEYIATNDMEIVASMTAQQIIETDGTYHIKYQNGKNGFDTPDDYIEAELAMVPHALSFPCRVEIEVYGNSNMIGAAASLKGFAGSALMSSRQPSSDFTVTHQLTLNNKQQMGAADRDRVSIYSPEFVTFGPPLDGARVELDLRFGLVNGEVLRSRDDRRDRPARAVHRRREIQPRRRAACQARIEHTHQSHGRITRSRSGRRRDRIGRVERRRDYQFPGKHAKTQGRGITPGYRFEWH